MVKTRTAYEVGWNNMAYAINTYPNDKIEPLDDYVRRCRQIAIDHPCPQNQGSVAACDRYLSGVVALEYKGGWIPT